jgi:hypothetical protein
MPNIQAQVALRLSPFVHLQHSKGLADLADLHVLQRPKVLAVHQSLHP